MAAARVVPGRKPGLRRIVLVKREDGFELAGGDDDPAFVDLGGFRKTHEVRMRDSSISRLFLGPQGWGEVGVMRRARIRVRSSLKAMRMRKRVVPGKHNAVLLLLPAAPSTVTGWASDALRVRS
jgi:hypothetical protein